MINGLRHTGIVVSNLDEALDFYVGTLGFEVVRQMEEGGEYLSGILGVADIRVTTVKMSVPGGGMIELLYFPDHVKGVSQVDLLSPGPTHIALTVTDLEILYAKLIQQDIHFNAKPCISPDGMVKIAFCRAPDGTWLELVEMLE